MELTEPFKIYTADNTAEAILIAEMLNSNGLPAFADEDQFWALGMLPNCTDRTCGSRNGPLRKLPN